MNTLPNRSGLSRASRAAGRLFPSGPKDPARTGQSGRSARVPLLILSLLLAALFLFPGAVPARASVNYDYDDDTRTLTISGSGEITQAEVSACVSEDKDRIEHVIIEDGVTSIGGWSFGDYFMLTSVTIPSTVTSIGENAFRSCESLTSVTIPSTVTSIGDRAFNSCFFLESVTIRRGTEALSLGENVFIESGVSDVVIVPEDPALKFDITADAGFAIDGNTLTLTNGGSTGEAVLRPYRDDLFITVYPIPVNFVFLSNDGIPGVPLDIKEETLHPVLSIKDGDQVISQSNALELPVNAGEKDPGPLTAAFTKEVDLAPGKYTVSVGGLPKTMSLEIPGGNAEDAPKYDLTAKAEINEKTYENDRITVITVYLIFTPPAPKAAEPVVYILPEDEIGAYALRNDGTKEYLLFHTYDICMNWLGSDELCSGYERCFHKDGK